MPKKYLIVVDMQKDFVNGALGSKEAAAIVPAVLKKVKEFDGEIIFTYDTHTADYMETQEGHMLPVPHCIEGTEGWELVEPLKKICQNNSFATYRKPTFGCVKLAADLKEVKEQQGIEFIELIGVCTDICVISNALLLKANMPEVPIYVDAACCAGVTPTKHQAALEAMRSCQIIVK